MLASFIEPQSLRKAQLLAWHQWAKLRLLQEAVGLHLSTKGFGLNEFAERLDVSPAYWSHVEREQESRSRDDLVERVATVLEVKLDDLFCEAGHLLPDLRGDLKVVVTFYRRGSDTRKANSKR